MLSFLQESVGVKTLRPYLGINDSVIPNWKYLDGENMGMPETATLLAAQMRRGSSARI